MRTFWIIFGIGTHVLFACTVCRLFPFLQGHSHGLAGATVVTAAAHPIGALSLDALLAAQFAFLHSWLLLPRTRERLKRIVPTPQYGCFFCVVSCASLLMTIECWTPSSLALWRLDGA